MSAQREYLFLFYVLRTPTNAPVKEYFCFYYFERLLIAQGTIQH